MAKATGFGGAFLRARNPEALYAWYEQHLGLKLNHGCFTFPAAEQKAHTVIAFFPADDTYWPVKQPAMLNFQVDDVDTILDALKAAGIEVDPKRETYDYGRFGWFIDPEGNRVELWQPNSI
ncbi:MAG TPA: VOC family protein [Pseudacidobacterium sp.]|jgi:predicted enzyme related to lactoylglutathione lyase|nr:VOC family protein [Pseudacidobacterium sp.]